MDDESDGRTVRAPEEHEPWYAVWDAHLRAEPLCVQVIAAVPEGWTVEYRGIVGLLRDHGAPADWAESPPAEVDAWVLKFDRDAPQLELVAWSPRTGPAV